MMSYRRLQSLRFLRKVFVSVFFALFSAPPEEQLWTWMAPLDDARSKRIKSSFVVPDAAEPPEHAAYRWN